MRTVLWTAPAVALVLTLAAMRCLAPLARRIGLVDHPDGGRKDHRETVPLTGGLAILIGVLAASLFPSVRAGWPQGGLYPLLLLGFLGVGVWDDLYEPSARLRLLFESGLVLVAIGVGRIEIRDLGLLLGDRPLDLGPAALPFTFLAILGFINAVNFLDGLDGLAAGVGLVAWLGLLVLALAGGLWPFAALALVWVAALLAYLPGNLGMAPRILPKVFLGDSGSLLLGSGLAYFALALHRRFVGVPDSPPAMSYAWILGYPVVDALIVIVRRRLRGGSPLRADRTHLHHLLLDRGLRSRLVVLLLVALTGVYTTLGVAGWYVLGLNDEALFLLFVCAGAAQAWVTFGLVRSARALDARRGRSGG